MIMNRAEHKYYTTAPAITVTATTVGVVLDLTNALVEGDQVTQRTGRVVQMDTAELRFDAFLPTAAGFGSIRFIWVADNLNTGTVPTVSDILLAPRVTSPYSLANVSTNRFSILADVIQPMVVGGNNQQTDHVLSRKRKTKIHYNGSTAVPTSNGKGCQFLLVITDIAVNSPVYSADYALHFTDI